MSITTYPVSDGFVVSDDGTWLPGIYATEAAAEMAGLLPDWKINAVWKQVLERGDKAITEGDLA